MNAVTQRAEQRVAGHSSAQARFYASLDRGLLIAVAILLCFGLVMVESASIPVAERQLGQPFYYLERQALYAVFGLLLGAVVVRIRLVYWEKTGLALLLFASFLLLLVLIPGVGVDINGGMRWLNLRLFKVQVSEPARLFVLIYLAGYLVRHGEQVRTSAWGFGRPMIVLSLLCLLLLMEPDFGASAVLLATALGMMYLAGVRLWRFALLLLLTVAALAVLVVASPYRLERLTTFMNPWAHPYHSGFQLTQSLIAIGRGGLFGVGLGGSILKLFYLPEAPTDFLFAIIAEELGLAGITVVIGLYAYVVWRAFVMGARAERSGNGFAAYLAYGIGIGIGLQAFINIGVNMGVLPTKGLTLPLLSYGGSSMLVTCLAIALLLRIGYETRSTVPEPRSRVPAFRSAGKGRRA